MPITLVIKGKVDEAENSMTRHGVVYEAFNEASSIAYSSKFDNTVVRGISDHYLKQCCNWFLDGHHWAPPFPHGTLLHYSYIPDHTYHE